jgi:hypothetical protein
MQENIRNHIVTIEQKKRIYVSGVESVLAFSSMRITLNLSDGNRLFIAGNALKITAFSKESGDFETVGEITSVSYGGRMGSKLFK